MLPYDILGAFVEHIFSVDGKDSPGGGFPCVISMYVRYVYWPFPGSMLHGDRRWTYFVVTGYLLIQVRGWFIVVDPSVYTVPVKSIGLLPYL